MTKSKMILSLVALIGASLVFVVATFAWLAVSQYIDVGGNIVDVYNAETTATLQVSADGGLNYSDTNSLTVSASVPGNVYYFRLVIQNTGSVALSTSVYVRGFTDSVADALGDPTNYNNGQTLRDILIIDANNTGNSYAVTATTMTDLIGSLPVGVGYDQAVFTLASAVPIAASATQYVYFTITVDPDAGNDFQNLNLDISQIQVSSVG